MARDRLAQGLASSGHRNADTAPNVAVMRVASNGQPAWDNTPTTNFSTLDEQVLSMNAEAEQQALRRFHRCAICWDSGCLTDCTSLSLPRRPDAWLRPKQTDLVPGEGQFR